MKKEMPKKSNVVSRQKPIIVKVFDDSDLRCGHKGLGLIARKAGIRLETLPPGEFLLFINKAGTGVKLITNGNLLVYLKSSDQTPIDTRIIETLPRFFNGSDFDYTSAAKVGLDKAA